MKIFLVGLLGSGKSYLGKALSQAANLPFIDLDEAIELQEGISIAEIFSRHDEAYFRKVEAEVLRTQTQSRSDFVMATGGGAPCFHHNMQYMNAAGTTVFINTPITTIVQRMDAQQVLQRPLLAGTSESSLKEKLKNILQQRISFYEQAHISCNGESITAEQLLQLLKNHL